MTTLLLTEAAPRVESLGGVARLRDTLVERAAGEEGDGVAREEPAVGVARWLLIVVTWGYPYNHKRRIGSQLLSTC
jgi:hypothetical protein